MKFPLNTLTLFDVHLGHHNTPTSHILDVLLNDVLTYENLKGIDILFIAGDWLDRALLNSDPDVSEITRAQLQILEIADSLGITILIVEGTPAHDAGQPRNFYALAKYAFPHLDFRYYTDMVIDYIEKYDISIMTVPDEWASREEMYLKAKSLLNEHKLDKVDFILGHNQFGYQFKEGIRQRISTLNEDDWSDMIRYTGFFGHVHRRSTYKHIEVGGSLDRLAHGEEHPKGYLTCHYRNEEDWDVIFHENKRAAIYEKYRLPTGISEPTPELISQIHDYLSTLNHPHINIRFEYDDPKFPMKALIQEFKPAYPFIRFTAKRTDQAEDTSSVNMSTLPDDDLYEVINLNRDNLLRLFMEHAKSKGTYTQQDLDHVKILLTSYINGVN